MLFEGKVQLRIQPLVIEDADFATHDSPDVPSSDLSGADYAADPDSEPTA